MSLQSEPGDGGVGEGLGDGSASMMPPPPLRKPVAAATAAAAAVVTAAAGDHRHMNDTTMPPRVRFAANEKSDDGGAETPKKKVFAAVNPRARGPRFGLHDWKRLLMASKDLAQLKGEQPRRDIPLDEIRKHNRNHDGWIILRGKVYNIGPYLPYHPGGIDIFKNVLGKDATSLFDKYHRWVNIDGLIGPLFIGTAASSKTGGSFSLTGIEERPLVNSAAPRVPPAAAASSTLLTSRDTDNEEEEDLLFSKNVQL